MPDDWLDAISIKRGHADPVSCYTEPSGSYEYKSQHFSAWLDMNRAVLDAWYETRDAIESEYGVTLGVHCSDGGYPLAYLAAVEYTANRGCPLAIETLETPAITGLSRWLADFSLDPPSDCRWWLVSYWWG